MNATSIRVPLMRLAGPEPHEVERLADRRADRLPAASPADGSGSSTYDRLPRIDAPRHGRRESPHASISTSSSYDGVRIGGHAASTTRTRASKASPCGANCRPRM